MKFKYQLSQCRKNQSAVLQSIKYYNVKNVCTYGGLYGLLQKTRCIYDCSVSTSQQWSCNVYINWNVEVLSQCCTYPLLYKYKVLYKSTNKYKKQEGGKKCNSKTSRNNSSGKKNLEKVAKIKQNSFKSLENRRLKGNISSKFYKNYHRCVQTVKNSVFKSNLYILPHELIKSKICSLKRFISISRGILNLKLSSFSNDPVGIMEIDYIKSSQFYQKPRRCVQTIRNDLFRGDLNFSLPHIIKSKIHSLKRFISIFRGILNLKLSSFSNDPKKIANFYTSFSKVILPQNHLSSKSIHSLIGGKSC